MSKGALKQALKNTLFFSFFKKKYYQRTVLVKVEAAEPTSQLQEVQDLLTSNKTSDISHGRFDS